MSRGYQKGDAVAILMETRLDYAAVWLGLSKVGVIAALINTNLRKETLSHSIRVASSKAVIVSTEMLHALVEIIEEEEIKKLEIFVYDKDSNEHIGDKKLNLQHELENVSSAPIEFEGITSKDKLFYIYTSGTTGDL
jgi:solute carrier family 27 (fatty acid transporter), member 1/4